MSEYVADTHALYWHLTDDARLSNRARGILADVDNGLQRVHVPSIVLVEMTYLIERGRLTAEPLDRLLWHAGRDDSAYMIADLNRATALALRSVPRAAVPDMPDRIIVATALELGLPLISRDSAITQSQVVETVW